MPALGFGTYKIDDPALIGEAIDAGYRLLDTATRGYLAVSAPVMPMPMLWLP